MEACFLFDNFPLRTCKSEPANLEEVDTQVGSKH